MDRLLSWMVATFFGALVGLAIVPKSWADFIQTELQPAAYQNLSLGVLIHVVWNPSTILWYLVALPLFFVWKVLGIRGVGRGEYLLRFQLPLVSGCCLAVTYRIFHLELAPRLLADVFRDPSTWLVTGGVAAVMFIALLKRAGKTHLVPAHRRFKERLRTNDFVWANWWLNGNATPNHRVVCPCSDTTEPDKHACEEFAIPEHLLRRAAKRPLFERLSNSKIPKHELTNAVIDQLEERSIELRHEFVDRNSPAFHRWNRVQERRRSTNVTRLPQPRTNRARSLSD